MSIYDINPEFLRLLDKDEYTEEDLNLIDRLSNDEKDKCITIAGYIQNMRAELSGVEKAIETMRKREDRLYTKIDTLAGHIINKMDKCNLSKISDSPNFELSLHNNRKHVEVYDPALLPSDYWRTKETSAPNKDLIYSDITELQREIPGARLVADKRLVIK